MSENGPLLPAHAAYQDVLSDDGNVAVDYDSDSDEDEGLDEVLDTIEQYDDGTYEDPNAPPPHRAPQSLALRPSGPPHLPPGRGADCDLTGQRNFLEESRKSELQTPEDTPSCRATNPTHPWHVYKSCVPSDGYPHEDFIVVNRRSAGFSGDLVQGGIETILSAIVSRYEDGRSHMQEQKIMPVLLNSTIGRFARVVQAHYNGLNVVIQDSQLIDPRPLGTGTDTSFSLVILLLRRPV
ncbi:uncharacterized protein BDV17DRAFT_293340 [Aspergillus undulatus]|uniref:uncharacterized protein n=1 Tax=Aspergillus undulatus TaxID=1810928 RepID=UPI003CCE162C